MAATGQLLPDRFSDACLDLDVATVEGRFREARGFERHLNVHSEIDDVGHELCVSLRLVPSAHDPEADREVALAHERGNDGVKRALSSGERVGLAGFKIEACAAVMEREAGAGRDHAGTVTGVVAL